MLTNSTPRAGSNGSTKRLPLAPLVPLLKAGCSRYADDAIARRNGGATQGNDGLYLFSLQVGVSDRHMLRMLNGQADSINVYDADRICIAMGIHPALVWDEWVDLSLETTCATPRCNRIAKTRGLCLVHYTKQWKAEWRAHGLAV